MVVIVLGTVAVTNGELTIGGLLVFITYLTQLYGPVRDLGSLSNTIFKAAAGAERVIELLDEQPRIVDRPGAVRVERARGVVELDGVTFTYPGAAAPALRDVTPAGRAGPDGRAGGRLGRRQDDAGQAAAALLRPGPRGGPPRRPRPARPRAGVAAAQRRDPAAGDARAARQRARQHRLRAAGRERRRDPRRGRGRGRRRVHRGAAGRLRHRPRRARPAPLRRPAPAGRDRPRPAGGRAGARARRALDRPRRRGARGARRAAAAADARPHDDRDLARPADGARRGRDPRARGRRGWSSAAATTS